MKLTPPISYADDQRKSIFKAAACTYLLGSLAFGQAQNILTNGGFENGLMCYNTAIWNVQNTDFPSDYQFVNSSDAHSGTNSIEIICITANCLKAAIYSTKIQTPPSQAYKLSLYTKCAAGRLAAAYVPGTAGGDTFQYLTCNGSWAQNTVNFTVAPAATDFFFYVYNRDVTPLLIDDLVLTYADGTVPQNPVVHAGNRSVSVSGQQVNVDGKPYFALGFYDVEYADLGAVASLGANIVTGFGYSAGANCYNTAQESYLDRAYEFGLNFLPDSTTTARLGVPGEFPGIAAQYGHHLANIGWYLADEPDQSLVPSFYIGPATVVSEYQALSPAVHLPIVSDFQRAAWSVPSDTQPYIGGTDIWMAEPYGADFSTLTHAVNTFNSLAAKPIWLAQDDIDPTLIVPKAYWATVSGATGIVYFYWDIFKSQPAKMAATQQAFSELNQLTPAIFSPAVAVTPPSGIGAIGRLLNGSTYILAANPVATTVQGSFAVQGLTAGTPIQVMFENRTLVGSAGGFSDTFAGVSRHVYVIAPAKQTPVLTWANPAAIVSGTALGATQLNATANVPGTFSYTPAAGTVLPVGNSQTLSVTFTPADASTYTTAIAGVAINVLPKPAKLTVTRTVARDPVTRVLTVNMVITNTGGIAAQNVVLTAGKINQAVGTPLPQSLGTIQPNASATASIQVAGTAGNTWSLGLVTIGGPFTGGWFANITWAMLP